MPRTEITSEDFTKNRTSASRATGKKRKRPGYRLVSTQPPRSLSSPVIPVSPTSSAIEQVDITIDDEQVERRARFNSATEQVGITIWRLRPSTSHDVGPKISVREADNTALWTPERAEADTLFTSGERVRISIESPRTGYLYVIDREQYADDKLSEPLLIFPTMRTRSGSNQVRAGVLIDLPAQEDTPPYFTLNSNRSDYLGNLLTIIVAPRPIEGLKIGRQPLLIPPDQLARWEKEWGMRVQRFEMDGGAGAAWTPEEQAASHISGRALTHEEPAPQTIYRVAAKPASPLLFSVQLRTYAPRFK